MSNYNPANPSAYPPQSTTQATTGPYTTTETTTTTHTSRAPHSSTTTTAGAPLAGERVSSGEGMMGKIKGAAAAVHGTGEALRGAFNEGVDNIAGDKYGVEKNRQVEEKGLNEIRQRDFHPATTTTAGVSGAGAGTSGVTGTGAGAGAGGVGGSGVRHV